MKRRKPEAESKISLPITAMLDMTFQLLFFFIINFRPADLEGQMDMALPAQDEKQAHDAKTADPTKEVAKDPQPEIEADLTLRVRTPGAQNSQGGIDVISISDAKLPKEKPDEVKDLDALKAYLDKKKKEGKIKDAIKVQGDGRLRMKHVIEVMDVCRNAGIDKISFVPPS